MNFVASGRKWFTGKEDNQFDPQRIDNAYPVELISHGTWEAMRAEADRIIRLAEGRENVCMGTGALPYDTPPENVLRLMEYVRGR